MNRFRICISNFEPSETYSAHYFTHPQILELFTQWVEEQNTVVAETIEKYRELSPIKKKVIQEDKS
ncbi:MAG: N-acetyltransferase [Deltaproteobacteria bacterium]|nr:N-acetyltransferase [Deltaproteobacteria bacterium]